MTQVLLIRSLSKDEEEATPPAFPAKAGNQRIFHRLQSKVSLMSCDCPVLDVFLVASIG